MHRLFPSNYEDIIKEFSRTYYELQFEINLFHIKDIVRFFVGSRVRHFLLVVYKEFVKQIEMFVMLRLQKNKPTFLEKVNEMFFISCGLFYVVSSYII
jgi:hypothetical protein